MAKKKQNTRQYLSCILPEETKKYKTTRINWGGLNLKNPYNSGNLSLANGVSTSLLPYIETEHSLDEYTVLEDRYNSNGRKILGLYESDDCTVVIYSENTLEKNGNVYSGRCAIFADIIVKELIYYYSESVNLDTYTAYKEAKRIKNEIFTFYLAYYPVQSNYEQYYCNGVKSTNSKQEAWEFVQENFGIDTPRNVSMFSVYTNPTDPVGTKADKRLLIFPDKCSLGLSFEGVVFDYGATSMSGTNIIGNYYSQKLDPNKIYIVVNSSDGNDSSGYNGLYRHNGLTGQFEQISKTGKISPSQSFSSGYPDIKYAVTYNSRLYGVDDDKIYVSGFNNYADMALDTVSYSRQAGAWMTTTQASAENTGSFRAVCGFAGEVIAFKENYMYSVVGTENPFRLKEICAIGCVDFRSVCELDAQLYFAGKNGIYVYRDGYLPTLISDPIQPETSNITSATAYTENHRYHINIDGKEYIYDAKNGSWTKTELGITYAATAKANENILLAAENNVYAPGDGYRDDWMLRTDFINSYTSDTKHPIKLQLMYEIHPQASIKITLCVPEKKDSQIYSYKNSGTQNAVMHARVLLRYRNLESYAVKVSGSGYVKLHAIEIVSKPGGDLFE